MVTPITIAAAAVAVGFFALLIADWRKSSRLKRSLATPNLGAVAPGTANREVNDHRVNQALVAQQANSIRYQSRGGSSSGSGGL